MKAIESENAPAPIGPYSQAILHNGILYISGQIAIDQSSGRFIQDNIRVETEQVMANIQAILEEAGSSLQQVIKCSIFLRDMNDFAAVNEVYGSYFTENKPARETVQVSRLPKDANVEISVIAAVG
jgi:2-iminobutanoate/2-iminopropanoate deaminase